ncbi:MAG: translation initiation factor [Solirubrobacteraceae bacterium]
MQRNARLIYSSSGDEERAAGHPALTRGAGAGAHVKARREVAGRRGKAVTTVSEVPLDDAALKALASRLKKRCGVGGSVKHGVIEIQGDHRDDVLELLKAEGYNPVLAGG